MTRLFKIDVACEFHTTDCSHKYDNDDAVIKDFYFLALLQVAAKDIEEAVRLVYTKEANDLLLQCHNCRNENVAQNLDEIHVLQVGGTFVREPDDVEILDCDITSIDWDGSYKFTKLG